MQVQLTPYRNGGHIVFVSEHFSTWFKTLPLPSFLPFLPRGSLFKEGSAVSAKFCNTLQKKINT